MMEAYMFLNALYGSIKNKLDSNSNQLKKEHSNQ